MNSEKIYITTTLPYVNAEPHIGHALEFVQADASARYFRQKLGKENVFFNVGTDEHGLKIYRKALEENISIYDFVDKYAQRFVDYCKLFFVDYDFFYRTSSKEHVKVAQEFWKRCADHGDIYKKNYKGLYCVGCERFITEKELVDGKCPDHNIEPEQREEENYFFRLTSYREKLLKWLNENPDCIKPKPAFDELKKIISEIEDISISRVKENLPWGIDVPGDDSQVMYVWFDALTNYVGAVGFGEDERKLMEWWKNSVQFFGPDNLRFQGAIWQGMLMSGNLPNTKKLLRHGMVLASDGRKMSKSLGNVVSPFEEEKKYGAEIVRFYLLAGISTFFDSAYREEDLVNMYNARLADNYGNLLNRVIHLANSTGVKINDEENVEKTFLDEVNKYESEISSLYEDFELSSALEKVDELADFGNKYITKEEPWSKGLEKGKVEIILNNLSYLLSVVTKLYYPAIPISSAKAEKALKNREKIILFNKLQPL